MQLQVFIFFLALKARGDRLTSSLALSLFWQHKIHFNLFFDTVSLDSQLHVHKVIEYIKNKTKCLVPFEEFRKLPMLQLLCCPVVSCRSSCEYEYEWDWC